MQSNAVHQLATFYVQIARSARDSLYSYHRKCNEKKNKLIVRNYKIACRELQLVQCVPQQFILCNRWTLNIMRQQRKTREKMTSAYDKIVRLFFFSTHVRLAENEIPISSFSTWLEVNEAYIININRNIVWKKKKETIWKNKNNRANERGSEHTNRLRWKSFE